MFRKFIFAAALWLLAASPSNAFWHGVSTSVAGPTGISQIGIDSSEFTPQFMTNALKGMAFVRQGTSGVNVGTIDVNQYPISGTLDTTVSVYGEENFNLWASQQYVISIPATRNTGGIFFNGTTFNVTAMSHATVNGSSTPGSFVNPSIAFDGTANAASVTFTCTAACNDFTVQLLGTFTAGSGEWIMCRNTNNGGSPNDDCSKYALAASTAGVSGSFWTPEGITAIKDTNAGWLRGVFLMNPDNNGLASWGYRPQISFMSWGYAYEDYIIPGATSGGATNHTPTATLSVGGAGQAPNVYTAAPSDDENNGANGQGLGAWADGETIFASFGTSSSAPTISGTASDGTTNCSGGGCVVLALSSSAGLVVGSKIWVTAIGGTTEANGYQTITNVNVDGIHVTINVHFVNAYASGTMGTSTQCLIVTSKAGNACIPILFTNSLGYSFCNPLSVPSCSSTGAVGTGGHKFVYNAVLGALLATSSIWTPPVEAFINLVNQVNMNAWVAVTPTANTTYISSLATLLFNTVNSQLKVLPEAGNEGWNDGTGFTDGYYLGITRSFALGLPDKSSWQGLRYAAQIDPLFIAAGYSGANRSRLETAFMWQIGNVPQTFGWNGSGMNPTNNQPLCLFLGGTFSGTCSITTGSAGDHSTFPNRPIDLTDTVGYAPYAGGNNMCAGPDTGCTLNVSNVPFYNAVIADWTQNTTAGQNAAIALIDNDMRGLYYTPGLTLNAVTSCAAGVWQFTNTFGGSTGFSEFSFATTGTYPSTITLNTSYQLATKPTSSSATFNTFVNGSVGPTLQCGTGGTGTLSGFQIGVVPTILQFSQGVSGNFLAFDQVVGSYNIGGACGAACRPVGMSNIKERWYEGSMETGFPITAAGYTTLGITVPTPSGATGTTHGNTIVDNLEISGTASASGFYRGQVASATDITASQTVVSVNTGCPGTCNGNYLILSANASGSNTNEALTLTDTAGNAALNVMTDAVNNGWNNDPSRALTMEAYYQAFMGTDPTNTRTFGLITNATSPSNLKFVGGPFYWPLYPFPVSGLANSGINTTKWQTYCGIEAFNGGTAPCP